MDFVFSDKPPSVKKRNRMCHDFLLSIDQTGKTKKILSRWNYNNNSVGQSNIGQKSSKNWFGPVKCTYLLAVLAMSIGPLAQDQ